MPANSIFEVRVLIFDVSESARSSKDSLEREESIMDSPAKLKFKVEFAGAADDLLQRMSDLAARTDPVRVIAVSAMLAARTDQGAWQPTALVRKVRDLFIRNPNHLCGLIALLSDKPHRISDVDAVLKSDDISAASLKRILSQIAARLWLKSPVVAQSSMAKPDVVRIRCVKSEGELKKCFELRHRVYDMLGYLEEPVSRSASQIDMDSFDTKAIHFAAVDHRSHDFLGTARLVTTVTPSVGQSVKGNLRGAMRVQAEWAKAIAAEALLKDDCVFHRKIHQPIDLPFPLLLNSDFGTKYRAFMEEHPPASGGEVSRVVVSPLHRGLGISALLMRAVISTAFHLKKRFLLLECVPAHAKMYEKYGFRLIEGHHFRAQDLDQLAVGMSLSLDDHPFNKAVALAKSDGQMLGESGFLCLCLNTECWKRREFEFRHKDSRCPLIQTHGDGNLLQAKVG